jgi:CheY-like chemotaxis protein
MHKHRVLIVEDEQDIAGLIKHTLERNGGAEAEVVGSGDLSPARPGDSRPQSSRVERRRGLPGAARPT